MHFGDVVDQFHDQNRLANTRTPEETDFAALGIGRQKVDNLDACHQNFAFRGLFGKLRRVRVNGATGLGFDRAFFIDRLADHVDDASQCFRANGNRDRLARVGNNSPAHQTFGRIHCHGANRVFAKVLRHFKDQLVAVILGL